MTGTTGIAVFALSLMLGLSPVAAEQLLIPMDIDQADHLKAYGVAYHALEDGMTVEWILNYRSGSFLLPADRGIMEYALLRGVTYEVLGDAAIAELSVTIEESNMSREMLEKAPKIAVYTPPNKQPWDDAVTLVLAYAEIPYDTLWDRDVLSGGLSEYDWLHLHHEDFTGQYGKFHRNYRFAEWYVQQQQAYEAMAAELGYASVSGQKKAVAALIREYVVEGGFIFAMCSATDTIDIALAAEGVDIVSEPFDGDPPDPDSQQRLDYTRTFAFENFTLITDPMVYEFSDIDILPETPASTDATADTAVDYFSLFAFSAKYDPVPTMLTQCHENPVRGFMGQTTEFNTALLKDHVLIMGESGKRGTAKYIHGTLGDGTFTFFSGHDPEDYRHFVGDPPTQLILHQNSPGYRLILNNVLFPGARKKELKT
jgi:hypothetical protein